MAKEKKYKFVEVTWEDAVTYSGWKTEEAIDELVPDTCVSRGYLLRHNDKYVVIAGTRSEDEFAGVLIIPATWIKKIRTLKIG